MGQCLANPLTQHKQRDYQRYLPAQSLSQIWSLSYTLVGHTDLQRTNHNIKSKLSRTLLGLRLDAKMQSGFMGFYQLNTHAELLQTTLLSLVLVGGGGEFIWKPGKK